MSRIYNFDQFVNEAYEINESGFSSWLSKFGKKAIEKTGNYLSRFYQAIKAKKDGKKPEPASTEKSIPKNQLIQNGGDKLVPPENLVKLIPSGKKQGLPMIMPFSQEVGSVKDQVKDMFGGTPGSLWESEISEARKAKPKSGRIGLKFADAFEPGDKRARAVKDWDTAKLMKKLELLWWSEGKMGGKGRRERRSSKGEVTYPNIFIYGAPGIGKSYTLARFCDAKGIDMINLDLQFMDKEDFMGVPSIIEALQPTYREETLENPENKGETTTRTVLVDPGVRQTVAAPPTSLPVAQGKRGKGGILFLDEMNRASENVLNAVFTFVQTGKIGEAYTLPPNWIMVAAGNRPGEEDVQEPKTAFWRRFIVGNLVPTVEDYEKFVKEEDPFVREVPEIIIFLKKGAEDPEVLLHYLDPENPYAFPCPANWSRLALAWIQQAEFEGLESWRDLSREDLEDVAIECVGESAAYLFMEFLDIIWEMSESDLQTVLENPKNAKMVEIGGSASKEGDPFKKGKNFGFGILIAISYFLLNLVKEGEHKKLANIAEYFERYNYPEIMSFVFAEMRDRFPEITKFNNPDLIRLGDIIGDKTDEYIKGTGKKK